MPFEALIAPDDRFVAERTAVSYAPSLTALASMRALRDRRLPAGDRTLLAVSYGLPGGDELTATLSGLYGPGRAKVLAGKEATREAFLAACEPRGILHVAAHGALNDAAPLASTLALAPTKTRTGDLEARDLLDRTLRADLAVLSGCETGRGRTGGGEGIVGFSWALSLAGCPAAVVSRWRVDVASTSKMMRTFHETLLHDPERRGRSLDAAGALRRAGLDLSRAPETRHPFYWAGFFVVGASP